MQKWQTNLIVKAFGPVGLDPRQFDFENGDSHFVIKHKSSPSCFTICSEGGDYTATYVVGDGIEWPISACGWQTILSRFSRWLKEVKSDLETPDLLADLQREAKLLDATFADATENTPFTLAEQNEIKARLRALAEHAQRTYSLSAAQMQALDAKLDYLVEAARRVGRKDWLILFSGVIFSYILTALLPPEAAYDLFLMFLRTIGHFHGFSDLPLLP